MSPSSTDRCRTRGSPGCWKDTGGLVAGSRFGQTNVPSPSDSGEKLANASAPQGNTTHSTWGKDLEQREQASLWLPGRWPLQVEHSGTPARGGSSRMSAKPVPSLQRWLRAPGAPGTEVPEPDLRQAVRGRFLSRLQMPTVQDRAVKVPHCHPQCGKPRTLNRLF